MKAWSILAGGLVGLILPLLGKLFPKYEKWIPSASGFGLAWTFQWFTSLQFFLRVIAYGRERTSPKQSREFMLPGGVGNYRRWFVDGGAVDFLGDGPQLIQQLFHH